MNGKQILILKEALDQISKDFYKELPTDYANKAIKIIRNNINKAINKLMNKN